MSAGSRPAVPGQHGGQRHRRQEAWRRHCILGIAALLAWASLVASASAAAVAASSAQGWSLGHRLGQRPGRPLRAQFRAAASNRDASGSERGLGLPWKVAAWNQHRQSSYYQKCCPWFSDLGDLGHSKSKVCKSLTTLDVHYSPLEIQTWASNYDVLLIQEADPLFRSALGELLSSRLVAGRVDRDGRGVKVDSCNALLLNPDSGIVALTHESALLSVNREGIISSRDHVVVLTERVADSQRMVFCSVHLHPPDMVHASGVSFLHYLRPLQEAIQRIVAKEAEAGRLEVPCFLAGDFNTAPSVFSEMLSSDPFWGQFRPFAPGGDTAHKSNPDPEGDFALCSAGSWSSRALGPPGFDAFERYASEVVTTIDTELRRKLRQDVRPRRRRLRKGLLTSDHRALEFTGWPLGDSSGPGPGPPGSPRGQ